MPKTLLLLLYYTTLDTNFAVNKIQTPTPTPLPIDMNFVPDGKSQAFFILKKLVDHTKIHVKNYFRISIRYPRSKFSDAVEPTDLINQCTMYTLRGRSATQSIAKQEVSTGVRCCVRFVAIATLLPKT